MQKPVADMSRKAMVEEEANKIIEKEVGARIKFEFIDSGARDSRINAMIASGEEFDLLLDMGSSFANNLRKNAFVDVTEYIDKYGADIKAKLDDFAWKAVEYGRKC